MEFAPFVPLRTALSVLRLAGTVLAEILGGFGDDVGEQLHLHSTERFA